MAAPVFFSRSPIFAERPETAFLVVFSQTCDIKMAAGSEDQIFAADRRMTVVLFCENR